MFGAIGAERIVPVPPPDPRVAGSRAVTVAQPDIVKITGVAPSCHRQLEGSGFLYANEHVMTNAHVVAGVRDPSVRRSDGRSTTRPSCSTTRGATSPSSTSRLHAARCRSQASRRQGESAVVAGYPQNGPFRAVPARIRAGSPAQGPDIYQSRQVTREIYAVYATVGRATPAARCSLPTAGCTAWSSPHRWTTPTPATP